MIQPIGVYLDELEEFHAFTLQAQAVHAVLLAVGQLRLLDYLDDGPVSAAEIAGRSGLNTDNVARVLRFLVSQQVVDSDAQHRFMHTARSRLLRDQQSGLQFLRESMGAAPGLAQCLRTGVPAFDCSYGKPVFQYLAENQDTVQYFGDLMSRTTAALDAFVFDRHRFEPFDLAVDVGGSHGRLMLKLLDRHPEARGIVFDLPDTAVQASAILAESPVADRIEAVGGDFFEGVPAGGDLYLLKQILHDWGDEECVRILRSIRSAIAERGRVAVIDFLLPDEHEHHSGFSMDMQMLIMSTGRERTLAEFEALLGKAGFRLDRVTANPRGQSIAEAVPA